MTKCLETAEKPLPQHHFAILFEGAWIFTPNEYGNGIVAICPITDDMHKSQFGTWNSIKQSLSPVDGFHDIEVQRHTTFTVTIEPGQIVSPEQNFTSLFRKAATEYPFIYLPKDHSHRKANDSRPLKIRGSAIANGRTVSIPIPTYLRAAGALMTAEVGGDDIGRLFGHGVVVKRAFTTFLFIYEYSGSLKADVCRTHREHTHCGYVVADEKTNPTPHLIFEIFPTSHGIASMLSGMSAGHEGMASMAMPDQSMLKLHASTTFEVVRQAIPVAAGMPTPCCDMALYHNQNDISYDCGDVGLSAEELGIQLPPPKTLFGAKLPACANGGVAAETEGKTDD